MSNPFYTYSGAFIPGILARAEAETTEFQAVQSGFDLLAVQGTDSGAADAYVVTLSGSIGASYTDGDICEFKAANANTGASTINVNGLGVVSLTDFKGVSLAGGSIAANSWYRIMYNSTYVAWTVIAPTSLVITSNTISSSAPTFKVGLTAAGGVSTACAPIDVVFALDQGIVPTWTGAHTFSNTVTFNSTVSFSGGLTLTGNAAQYAETLIGSSTSGQSLGQLIKAGTTSGDYALRVQNQTGATEYLDILGSGSVVVGNPTGGGKGVGTINAVNLYVNGNAVLTSSATSANPTATIGLSAVNGTSTNFMTSDSAPPLSQAIAPTWTGLHIFNGVGGTPIVTNPAANQVGITIAGGTNTALKYLAQFTSAQASGFSGGLLLRAGTTSADQALLVNNAANTVDFLRLKGDGSGTIGASATAGIQWSTVGGVTVNATSGVPFTAKANSTAIFEALGTTSPTIEGYGPTAAGLVDMTPDTGTFTLTIHVGSVTNTGTARWARMGNIVGMILPVVTASSNGTTFTATGLPAAITPAHIQTVQVPDDCAQNNGVVIGQTTMRVATTGTMTFATVGSDTGWINPGANGIATACSVSWILN
jgi:hypothetical protein